MHSPPRALVALAAALALGASLLDVGLLPPLDSPSGAARAAILQQYASQGQLPVAPGVTHDWGTFATGSGQQVVNFVEVQPGAPGISFDAALSNDQVPGLERPSSEANRKSVEGHRAIAAINGDVWSSSSVGAGAAPFGIQVENGELEVAGNTARPTFGVGANGQPLIGAPVVTTNLVTPDGVVHPINRINQQANAGETVLYTPRFGAQTDAGDSGTDVVLSGVPLPLGTSVNATATVVAVRAAGGQPIDPGTLVVTGPPDTYLASLVPGTTVQLTISITAGWETVTQAIGGREFLLRDGATSIDPHPSIADQRHPRTAIGVTATGAVILAVVDGRNAGYSAGVTDDDLASVMAQRGAVNAINLDGGGSTAMSVRQPGDGVVSVVNRPSGGSEQAVSNALLLFSAAPTGPLAILSVGPADQAIYPQSSIDFGVAGQDATYNPVALVPAGVTWSAQGLAGTFDSTGRFTATAPGSGTITATTNGLQGSTHLTVLADTTPPVAQPPLLSLVRGAILGSTVPVQVSWPAATDVGVGVAGYELQASVNAGSWKTVSSGSPLNRTVTLNEARGANVPVRGTGARRGRQRGRLRDRALRSGRRAVRSLRRHLVQGRLDQVHLAVLRRPGGHVHANARRVGDVHLRGLELRLDLRREPGPRVRERLCRRGPPGNGRPVLEDDDPPADGVHEDLDVEWPAHGQDRGARHERSPAGGRRRPGRARPADHRGPPARVEATDVGSRDQGAARRDSRVRCRRGRAARGEPRGNASDGCCRSPGHGLPRRHPRRRGLRDGGDAGCGAPSSLSLPPEYPERVGPVCGHDPRRTADGALILPSRDDGTAPDHSLAISSRRHRAFASRICRGVRHRTRTSPGLATSTVRQRAREVATLRRLRL